VKYVNVPGGFEYFVGRNNHGFRLFCVTNMAIPTKPVSDVLEILDDFVLG